MERIKAVDISCLWGMVRAFRPLRQNGSGSKKTRFNTSPTKVNNDIYLLREGQEMGPFSEAATHSFLMQGAILIDDLAWTPGMAEWTPLERVLQLSNISSVASAQPAAAPVETRAAGEPATAKQKAFLSYIGIAFFGDTTKERAAVLVNEAMENPKLDARVRQWNDDRLTLHPDLFAKEAQAKKEERANHFFEACQHEGADRLMDVTKAHCQVLVTYLDVNFPNWDANEAEATWNYFFPAVSEKFPQLVRKPWRGKLNYPSGPRVATEIRQLAQAAAVRTAPSPIAALVRGMVFGLALLLVLYIAVQMITEDNAGVTPSAPASAPAISPEPQKIAVAPAQAPARMKPVAPASEPAPEDASMVASSPPAEASATEPAPADPMPAPVAPAPKTFVVITKATDVRLRYGNVKLPVGAQLKIVSQESGTVKVLYGSDTVTVPIEATDLAAPATSL